ncbi:MAG: ABC transporter substrate-binding protein [Pseudomonadota bacterium]|nr:ABC transporter substrate-binding protein [Pseudomonadota bacterium]
MHNSFLSKSALFVSFVMIIGASASKPLFSSEAGQLNPYEVIEKTASKLQEKLSGKQEYYSKNTDKLYNLIDSTLLPNFDIEHSGKLVLGKSNWVSASTDQRARFIDAFYTFLIKTYADAILEFDQERMIVKAEPKFSKDRQKAQVTTELKMLNGNNIQVNYLLRYYRDAWKIYDVRIDGVSYVQNYRNQFDAEISALGLDAVIERLKKSS